MYRMLALTGVAIAALTTVPAFAVTTAFTDRSAFDAATSSQVNYSFSEFAGQGQVNVGPSYAKGPLTFATQTGNLYGLSDAYSAPYLAQDVGDGVASGLFTIMSTGNAFGVYLGDYFSSQTVTYTSGGLTSTFNIPKANSTAFIGFVSDSGPFSVSFTDNSEIDVTSAISALAGAVPEPASWTMMLAGFGAVGYAMRRRRTSIRFA